MKLILANPWIIAVGGGLIVIFVGWIARRIFRERASAEGNHTIQRNNQSTVVTNNIYPNLSTKDSTLSSVVADEKDVPTLKLKAHILFIEDGVFKQIRNLEKGGWQVSQIKDVEDFDAPEIRDSQIIFVDYKDVGKKLSNDEGLGIVRALKNRYGPSKWVVLYSAHPQSLSVYDRKADSYLEKNSPLIDIEQKIIEGARAVIR